MAKRKKKEMTMELKRSKWSQLLASILVNTIYAMQNFPIMLLNSLLAPLSFLIVITFVSHGALLSVAIEGAFIMTMVSAGMALQADLSHLKNDMKVQDMVVSSPTSAFMYIAGMGISEIIYFIPNIFILSILAVLFIHVSIQAALVITAVMAIMFVFSIALSFLLSTFTQDIIQGWAFTTLVSTLLSTIPPVYYPITYIPMPYQYIAYLSPTTYAAQIAQSASGFLAISPMQFAIDWIVLILAAVVMFIIAAKKTRWREI
ncbi:MAG: ABC transporter permease [Candidatus Marsarchaeota archaeon]|nr:ABC transporter permease [Candidatus Marsarchaeota archaeon]